MLSGAWGLPDSVLLTLSNASQKRWAAFQTTPFLSCVEANQSFDPGCVRFNALLDGDAFPQGYAFSAVFAEPGRIVAPLVIDDEATAAQRPMVGRQLRPVVTGPGVSPGQLRDFLR
jgi:hypothetical protein